MLRLGQSHLLLILFFAGLCGGCSQLPPSGKPVIQVGSKKFIESEILGEAFTQLLNAQGHPAKHIASLGGSTYLWHALLNHEIDLYPEYTGTLKYELLKTEEEDLESDLSHFNLAISKPLGFSNNYCLAMKREQAAQLKISRISDLKDHADLKVGLSSEFAGRADGWSGLQNTYHLPQTNISILDHDLAYTALKNRDIDLLDSYSTDAEIAYHDLVILEDDRAYFPLYKVVILYRRDLAPSAIQSLKKLEGQIMAAQISRLNAMAKLEKVPSEEVASMFLQKILKIKHNVQSNMTKTLYNRSQEHFNLVFVSLMITILLAVPLGVYSAKTPLLGKFILTVTGLFQTIPALALLVLMIPLLGIGWKPAITALVLYSLLPIVRNTFLGISEIPTSLRESAEVLGLSVWARLWKVEIPLALPSILAGIKTAAVINVGTATLGALIGAGGYGQLILRGIQFDDMNLILWGAIPAALMALTVQYFFEILEWLCVSPGLRKYAGK